MNLVHIMASGLGGGGGIPSILKDSYHYYFKFDSERLTNVDGLATNWLSEENNGAFIQSIIERQPKIESDGVFINYTLKGMQMSGISVKTVYVLMQMVTYTAGLRMFRPVPTSNPTGTIYQSAVNPELSIHSGASVVGKTNGLPVGEFGIFIYTINGANSFLQTNDNKVPVALNAVNITSMSIGTDTAAVAGIAPLFKVRDFVASTKIDSDAEIEEITAYLTKRKNKLFPKMVTLGDSITYQNKWQPTIVSAKNIAYLSIETQNGFAPHKAMGVGSSRIIPLINNSLVGQQLGNSIYERADDVKYYKPTLILLMGGQNDHGSAVFGEATDTPYTGSAVTENPPTFCSAYKGTLIKLMSQNPSARIVCLTPFYAHNGLDAKKQQVVDAIKDCAAVYNLECLDLLANSGINASNYTTYLADDVHPNDAGGLLIGTYVSENT